MELHTSFLFLAHHSNADSQGSSGIRGKSPTSKTKAKTNTDEIRNLEDLETMLRGRGGGEGRGGGGKKEIINILREMRRHCIHETRIGDL